VQPDGVLRGFVVPRGITVLAGGTCAADGTWSYDETTMLKMVEMDEPFAHTDHNTLRKGRLTPNRPRYPRMPSARSHSSVRRMPSSRSTRGS